MDVHLTHPASHITLLRIRFEYPEPGRFDGYWTAPHLFNYTTRPIERHPFLGEPASEYPVIEITTRDERFSFSAQLSACDTLVGFGPDAGAVQLAGLLLDASLGSNDVLQIDLEPRSGRLRQCGRWKRRDDDQPSRKLGLLRLRLTSLSSP